jgi:outer membrane receptor for ferrienterochelin and colicin
VTQNWGEFSLYRLVYRSTINAFFAAIILAVPCVAWAQASLDVSVIGFADKQPLPGLVVTLSNVGTGQRSEAITDGQGKVRFSGLNTSGSYTVSTNETGEHNVARSSDITLRSNFERSITLLAIEKSNLQALEEIIVVGSRGITRLNTINAEVSSTFSKEELETLPVEARDITRSLFRLPNVTQATGFFPEAPNISINGANSLFTNYMIDGLDNNENFLGGQKFPIPLGFAQSVTVLANNFSAEHGRTANGVVNVTSKSGSNDLEGEVFFLSRPGFLAKDSSFSTTDLTGNPVTDDFNRYQGGFGVGGPIIEDKTFYYANVEFTRDDKKNRLLVPDLGIDEAVGGKNEFLLSSLRLDHFWDDNWSSMLRFNHGRVSIGRQGGGIGGGVTFPSAANSQERTSTLLAFSTTYAGNNLTYEGRLQYSRFQWDYGDTNPGPQVTVQSPSGQTIAALGHPGFIFDDTENTYQTQHKVTLDYGIHTIKVGADIIASDFSLTGGGNVDGNYTVQLNSAQLSTLLASNVGANLQPSDLPSDVQVLNYAVELQPNAFGASQRQYGFYIEDVIAIAPRLNITAGIRWDYDSLSKSGGSGDLNNFAPRVSANYALNERMALRGGVGLFYDKIPYAVASDALQQNSTSLAFKGQLQQLITLGLLPADTDIDSITFDGNLTVNPVCTVFLACPTPAQSTGLRDTALSSNLRILNPNGINNPRSLQATLGYQWQVTDNLLFYADAIYSESRNLLRLIDLNAPTPFAFAGTPRSQADANASRPVVPVPGGARSIIISDTGGRAKYKALNFTVVKEKGDDPFAYRLSYTLSSLKNDTDDINFRAQDSNNFSADYGPSLNDRTHTFSGVLTIFPLKKLSMTIAGLVQSGLPVNFVPNAATFGTIDLNGDGQSFGEGFVGNSDRFPGQTRNSGRLPWSKTFDISLQYSLQIRGGALELRSDLFNVFDANNLSGYPVNFTQSNQVQIGGGGAFVQRSAAPPRTLQLSARYTF